MEKTLMERLEDVCRARGVEIRFNKDVRNGDIVYKKRINTIFIGESLTEENISALENELEKLHIPTTINQSKISQACC